MPEKFNTNTTESGPAGPNIGELIGVFEDIRRLVENPHNDFGYSGWDGVEDALAEIDGFLVKLRAGQIPYTGVLFLPTGPLQELSLSSGWGDEFVELADRYDAALGNE